MPGLPHHRLAASAGNLVEQHLARLDVGDDGGPGIRLQDIPRPQHEKLIAPQNTSLAVDGADPVTIAVESNTEVAAALFDLGRELLEVLRHRRVGVMRRERTVDFFVQHEVLTGQPVDDGADRNADGAIAGIPSDLELLARLYILQEPRRVIGQNV